MSPVSLTPEQSAAILDRQGHEPCPGVEIEFKRALGAVPGGPELHATIFRPATRPIAPAPALLAYHGGGFQGGNPDGCGAIAKHLALTLGFTTVSASYRLATAETSTFPGILHDALHAWRWVQSHATELHIDPRRVAVSGESAGVLPAAHLAVASPFIAYAEGELRPAALIAQWGCMDYIARWFDRNENTMAERALLGAGYETHPQLYHQASPVAYANGPLAPALFLLGRQDTVVHPRQGRIGHAAWQAAGAHSELQVIPNVGHCTEGDNRAQRAGYLATITGFMAARLPL